MDSARIAPNQTWLASSHGRVATARGVAAAATLPHRLTA